MEGRGWKVYINKELAFRSWHGGRQGMESLNKDFEFRSWHCGRQGGVVQSSTRKYFVQALYYKVVLGSALCKLCSTK